MTTHVGKIGRLSKDCREELGRRIEDGKTGKEIVDWLNGLPEVQAVLREKFEGHPINEQNVSAWRQAGHVEWLRVQSAQVCARQLVEEGDDLTEATRERSLGDCLGAVLAVEMSGLRKELLAPEVDVEKRWERLRELHREVSRLRRDDDRALLRVIRMERWDRELEREADEEERRFKQERKDWQMDVLLERRNKASNAEMFGGGEAGRQMAERLFRIKCDLPLEKSKGQSPKSKAQGLNGQAGGAVGSGGGTPPELAGGDACGTGTGKFAGPVANSPESRLIKADQDQNLKSKGQGPEALVQGPQSKAQSLGTASGEGRGINEVQGPKSKIQSLNGQTEVVVGSGGGTPPELAGGDACATRAPRVPDPDPETEAYIRWWQMNRGFEPFDAAELDRLYAAIPKQEEFNAETQRGEDAGELIAACGEGAGI